MAGFGIGDIQAIQRQLQEKYKDKWKPISPERGKDQLLWLMIELGEVADILKKQGVSAVMENEETRRHFIEEMCDVMMYFGDVMLCYDITPEEFERVYREKHARNMSRW